METHKHMNLFLRLTITVFRKLKPSSIVVLRSVLRQISDVILLVENQLGSPELLIIVAVEDLSYYYE